MPLDLSNLDVELLIDKSGSMSTQDCLGGKQTRWQYGQETTEALANAVTPYDKDGITVVTFARRFKVYENVTSGSSKVADIYKENSPMGGTDTAGVLKLRLDAFFARKAAGNKKNLLLIVMTDGAPDDEAAVITEVVSAANRVTSDDELAILFIQVGRDVDATRFLKKLDDDLVGKHGAKFDVVDTLPIDEVETLSPLELIEKAFAD